MNMEPSVCRLHPGVAVTGFCPACLRDRLAGLQPPSAADLRRCKSFSYARSAAHSHFEPQRRSCDLFGQAAEPMAVPVPEEEEEEEAVQLQRRMEPASRKSFVGGLLGKKLQQWRRKNKPKKEQEPMPGRHRQHSFRVDQLDPSFSLFAPEEESMPPAVPRSDGQIPVEEDLFYDYDNYSSMPGGCAQTRDYYFDSSSSSRRRRSVDRSAASGRNSFSDANVDRMTTNARVSPAIAAAEFYQAQSSILVHHHQYSGSSFGSASFRDHRTMDNNNKKPAKKGIKGWSIWGLIHKKSSSSSTRKPAEAEHGPFSVSAGAGEEVEYPWPELRARGYNGQMLRCNSSISARSSFSGGMAAMIGGGGSSSARRSISGMDMHDVSGHGSRRDEILLQRNLSTRSRSGNDHQIGAGNYQFSRPNPHVVPKGRSSKSSLPRRSTLGLY